MSDHGTREIMAAHPAEPTEHDRLLELSVDLMAVASFEGYFLLVSPAWTACLGWSSAELIGRPWIDFVHPEDHAASTRFLETLLAGRPVRTFENRYLHKDGSTRWLSWSALPNNESRQIFAVARDITGHREQLERHRQNERMLRMAGAVAKLGGWIVRVADGSVIWSDEVCAIHEVQAGFRPAFDTAIEFYAPESRAEVTRVVTACMEHGTRFVVELEIVTARGNRRWVRAMGEAVRDAADQIVQVQGALQDVTDRREAEAALRASEARFRTVVQSSWDVFHLVKGDGTIVYESPAVTRVLGYQPEEMEGRSAFDFIHPDDAAEIAKTPDVLPASGGSHVKVLRVRHKDGRWRWIESYEVNLLDHPDVGAFAVNYRDITDRMAAEARVREQASLLDRSQDAILVRDLDHKVLYWNKSAERRYGWSASEALGLSAQELIYGGLTDFEIATAATLAHGEWVGELRQRHKDGSLIVVEGRFTLVRDDDGLPRSILAVYTDLTERKKLERTEDQLRQAQKMEAVGNLAGGVAHDFNNLLSVILSYADMILADLPSGDPLGADLMEIRKAGLRATELTRQLLAFSRKQILEPVVFDLNQVVVGFARMLGRLLGEDIELTISAGAAMSRIFADPGQIEQVLMNLVVNARDAMPRGGNLTIETANVDLDSSYAAEHVGVVPGPYVMLAVSDTGHGMDRATQARIFEPFFTSKDKSKGTGLGLSTVYGIVEQSGGRIWVYSEPGVGTTFKVYLPRSDREVSTPTSGAPPASSLRGTETILLVEDEEQVRTIVRTILSREGYHVLAAQNGGEAFLVCEQFTAKIHLLLTDVVMPRMSGRQLAERLAPMRPEMKILYISGYTENTIVHHGVLDAGIEFLAKPIMPDALLRKVRAVLDGVGRGQAHS